MLGLKKSIGETIRVSARLGVGEARRHGAVWRSEKGGQLLAQDIEPLFKRIFIHASFRSSSAAVSAGCFLYFFFLLKLPLVQQQTWGVH